jgi:hypothetical protein
MAMCSCFPMILQDCYGFFRHRRPLGDREDVVEAAADGVGPEEAAKQSKELRQAIELWGGVTF